MNVCDLPLSSFRVIAFRVSTAIVPGTEEGSILRPQAVEDWSSLAKCSLNRITRNVLKRVVRFASM
jgi:hypothetical protein